MGHESSGFAAGLLLTRRQWFGRSAACLAALAAWRAAPLQARPPLGGPLIDAPFALGVASGAPLEDSVVIWTRLCTDPASPHGLGPQRWPVRWELAEDESFRTIVRSGVTDAHPAHGHSVHIEVTGLQPGRAYWYRFHLGGAGGSATSPVGRTRTAPPAAQAGGSLRFAFASCQQYEQGWYAAWRHMHDEAPDLVVFLGDYIYESSWGRNRVRSHGAPEPHTLEAYRARYALYRADPDLQRMHAAAPWLVTWDDHEVDNDYAKDRAEDLAEGFLARRAAAYQAFFEHMPLREIARPDQGAMRLYGHHRFGALAEFFVLDDRQYRDHQACPRPGRGGSRVVSQCDSLFDPSRTLLGFEQEKWLSTALRASRARWNVIAQQTLFSKADSMPGPGERFWTDGWDGYPAARRRLTDALVTHRVANPLIIGGDVHANWVCDVHQDFDRLDSPVIATEFCGTSITSQGRDQRHLDAQRVENPHVRLAESAYRGYVSVRLSAERCEVALRVVDDVRNPASAIATRARFVVEDGQPGAKPG
ncbi:MAG: Alkaline phosphatase [Pseudomonadota bacterium]|jgi:alkaline phosphatase D